MDYSSVNYIAVLVCAAVAFFIGFLWYSPMLFSKVWQKEADITPEKIKSANMVQIFGSSFVLMFVMILGLDVLLSMTAQTDGGFMGGFTFGLWVGVFFVAGSYGINILYQNKTLKLWLIDSVYQTLFLAVSGGILSIWK